VTPLLVADHQGHRLGYGGGFYDRYLSNPDIKALKAGLSFFEPIDEIPKSEPHDIPLDVLITPEKVYEF
jgi:5-formyltetrahydrofolate cyclo-ligase